MGNEVLYRLLRVEGRLRVLRHGGDQVVGRYAISTALVQAFSVTRLRVTDLREQLNDGIFRCVNVLGLNGASRNAPYVERRVHARVDRNAERVLRLAHVFLTVPSLDERVLVVVLTNVVANVGRVLLVVRSGNVGLRLFGIRVLLHFLHPDARTRRRRNYRW